MWHYYYFTFSSSSCVLGKCTFAGICVKFEKQMSKYSTQKSAKNSLKIVTDWKSCCERVKSFRLEFCGERTELYVQEHEMLFEKKACIIKDAFHSFFLIILPYIFFFLFRELLATAAASKQAKKIRNKEWIQRNLEKKREMKKKKEM